MKKRINDSEFNTFKEYKEFDAIEYYKEIERFDVLENVNLLENDLSHITEENKKIEETKENSNVSFIKDENVFTDSSKSSSKEKLKENNTNIIKKAIDKIGSAITSIPAAVGATVGAVVICSTFISEPPKMNIVSVDTGIDYLNYSIEVSGLLENRNYSIVVKNEYSEYRREITEDGVYSDIVSGLKPYLTYTISLVGDNGEIGGETTYYKETYNTRRGENPSGVFDIKPINEYTFSYICYVSDYYKVGTNYYLEIVSGDGNINVINDNLTVIEVDDSINYNTGIKSMYLFGELNTYDESAVTINLYGDCYGDTNVLLSSYEINTPFVITKPFVSYLEMVKDENDLKVYMGLGNHTLCDYENLTVKVNYYNKNKELIDSVKSELTYSELFDDSFSMEYNALYNNNSYYYNVVVIDKDKELYKSEMHKALDPYLYFESYYVTSDHYLDVSYNYFDINESDILEAYFRYHYSDMTEHELNVLDSISTHSFKVFLDPNEDVIEGTLEITYRDQNDILSVSDNLYRSYSEFNELENVFDDIDNYEIEVSRNDSGSYNITLPIKYLNDEYKNNGYKTKVSLLDINDNLVDFKYITSSSNFESYRKYLNRVKSNVTFSNLSDIRDLKIVIDIIQEVDSVEYTYTNNRVVIDDIYSYYRETLKSLSFTESNIDDYNYLNVGFKVDDTDLLYEVNELSYILAFNEDDLLDESNYVHYDLDSVNELNNLFINPEMDKYYLKIKLSLKNLEKNIDEVYYSSVLIGDIIPKYLIDVEPIKVGYDKLLSDTDIYIDYSLYNSDGNPYYINNDSLNKYRLYAVLYNKNSNEVVSSELINLNLLSEASGYVRFENVPKINDLSIRYEIKEEIDNNFYLCKVIETDSLFNLGLPLSYSISDDYEINNSSLSFNYIVNDDDINSSYILSYRYGLQGEYKSIDLNMNVINTISVDIGNNNSGDVVIYYELLKRVVDDNNNEFIYPIENGTKTYTLETRLNLGEYYFYDYGYGESGIKVKLTNSYLLDPNYTYRLTNLNTQNSEITTEPLINLKETLESGLYQYKLEIVSSSGAPVEGIEPIIFTPTFNSLAITEYDGKYSYTAKNPSEVLITFNSDNTFNAYIDISYQAESYNLYLGVILIDSDTNNVVRELNTNELRSMTGQTNIMVFEDLDPDTTYILNYYVRCEVDGMIYELSFTYPSGVINSNGELYIDGETDNDGNYIISLYSQYTESMEVTIDGVTYSGEYDESSGRMYITLPSEIEYNDEDIIVVFNPSLDNRSVLNFHYDSENDKWYSLNEYFSNNNITIKGSMTKVVTCKIN